MQERQEQEFIISAERSAVLGLKELWQYRELFYFFTWRDVKVKYKQTALGIIWVVLQPVMTVAIFSFFFGRNLNINNSGLPYPVFVFSGLLLWNFFSISVASAGNSMITNAPIIKKIFFPRIIIPVASLMVASVDFGIAFVVYLGVLVYFGTSLNLVEVVVFWPLALVLLVAGTLGISCWLAALSVKYRDFRYVIPFGLQLGLFVSPVIYPLSLASIPWLKYVLALNPMYGAINLFRLPFDVIAVEPSLILLSAFSSIVFLGLGIYYFKKTEAFFADLA